MLCMDTVKTRLLALESKISTLDSIITKMSGSITTSRPLANHHIFPTEEFIEYPLFEEMNTMKFLYKQKIDHGRTEKKYYEYSLVNPTEEMIELLGFGTPPDFSGSDDGYPIRLISFCDTPDKVETYGYEVILSDWKNPYVPLSDERKVKRVRDELDKYFFQVSDICSCGIRPSLFPSEIQIQFRNEYEYLPHVSFYLTPFQESSHLVCTIKSLTTKQVVFTIVQRYTRGERPILSKAAYSIPSDLMIHLHIRGIPTKKTETDLFS